MTQSPTSNLSRQLIASPSITNELIQVKGFLTEIGIQRLGRDMLSSGIRLLGRERFRNLSGTFLTFSYSGNAR